MWRKNKKQKQKLTGSQVLNNLEYDKGTVGYELTKGTSIKAYKYVHNALYDIRVISRISGFKIDEVSLGLLTLDELVSLYDEIKKCFTSVDIIIEETFPNIQKRIMFKPIKK